MNISMELVYKYMTIFFTLQVKNCHNVKSRLKGLSQL